MSGWNAYIDKVTEGSPAIKRVAIVGLADGSVWARTEGDNVFAATEAELVKFVAHFKDLSKVPATGADLENTHFIVPKTDEGLIFGRKDKSGFFAATSKTSVVIAIYEGEQSVGAEVRAAVERTAGYLAQVGY